MNRRGHFAFNAAVAAGTTPWVLAFAQDMGAAAGYAAGVLLFASGPDRLEGELFGRRLLPHRTITHWALPWALLSVSALLVLLNTTSPWAAVALGIGLGGLSHVVADATTPMGVPVWLPTKRHRLPMRSSTLMLLTYAAIAGGLYWSWMI